MPNTFMPVIKNEADVTLKSGIKVRFYRQEPFKFMNEIHKFLESLNIGEMQAFHMNTDANGWVNLAVAYREYKEPLITPDKAVDPIAVLYDTVGLLKDTVEQVSKLADAVKLLSPASKTIEAEIDGAH